MFDLKYRPSQLNEIIGNDSIKIILKVKSKNGSLGGRSLMFGGPKGCGKTTLARISAKLISCDNPVDGISCDKCDSCISIKDGNSINFDEFDASSQGSVEKMRELIQDLEYGTVNNKPRVIVLDEAHRLSKQSQDALLKPMEERKMVVILCTTEPHSIRSAIRDRVDEFSVSIPSHDDTLLHLKEVCRKENIEFNDELLDVLIKLNHGNPRTSLISLFNLDELGGVNKQNLDVYFKLDDYDQISESLDKLDSDIRYSISTLEKLMSTNGSLWVRDNIVNAISNSIKEAIGVKSSYPSKVSFYGKRGRSWAQLSSNLALLDKPEPSSIISVIINSTESLPIFVPPVQIQTPPAPIQLRDPIPTPVINSVPDLSNFEKFEKLTSEVREMVDRLEKNHFCDDSDFSVIESNIKVPKKEEPPSSLIEGENFLESDFFRGISIDGINFTPGESLTSFDHKVKKTIVKVSKPEVELSTVKLDKSHIPITNKELSNEISERFNK